MQERKYSISSLGTTNFIQLKSPQGTSTNLLTPYLGIALINQLLRRSVYSISEPSPLPDSLLLQEFLRDALVDKKISIFGQDFWRPLIHVEDMADACISSINSTSELISGQIYNVGSDEENYTKKQLAEIIQSYVSDTEIEIIESKIDPRNYKVSFDKIKTSLNFTTKKSVNDSITEILQAIDSGVLNPRDSEFTNISKLTEQISTLNNYQFDENL